MKFRIILVLAVLAISFSLLSCIKLSELVVEVSCDQFYENPHAKTEFQATVGDTVRVKLCSNPSTGFKWSETASISDQTVIQQTDHKLVMPESEPPPPPGTPGQEVWTFKALGTGTSNISLEYSRPWEGSEKGEWTFTATITVE